jgi:hypothetical protein
LITREGAAESPSAGHEFKPVARLAPQAAAAACGLTPARTSAIMAINAKLDLLLGEEDEDNGRKDES